MADPIVHEKLCGTCKLAKPIEEFSRRSDRPCGRGARCRSCNAAKLRRYRATPAGKEVCAKVAKKYCETPQGKENVRVAKARFRRTPKGIEAQRRGTKKYDSTEYGKAKRAAWRRSPNGRATAIQWHQTESGKASCLNSTLKRKYGITLTDYRQMQEEQGGRCFICSSGPRKGKRLGVDHNHTSGAVRKLLCDACNAGLGHFKDSPELLEKAIQYLRSHQEKEKAA